MSMTTTTRFSTARAFGLAWLALAACAVGCGSDEGTAPSVTTPGSRGVVQGGAQDAARFRALVEAGEVPAPDVLDPVGFFAEHALDLPPADCGEELCFHPSLAVAPRFQAGNWTMAFVAMNTSVDASTLARPPVHVALVVQTDGGLGRSITAGLRALIDALRPGDRVTLVPFGSAVHEVLADVAPDSVELDAALDTLLFAADAGPAPYDGLAAAARALAATPPGTARRLVLVTNGLATRGITSPERIVALAESIARDTTSLGVVGFGDDYDARLPTAIGDLGAGTYAYAQSEADLTAALRLEGETTLFPLATELELRVVPAPGYRVGRVYGASRARADAAGNVATLASPALFIGQRTGSSDVGGGRRGGGGGLFVELIADGSLGIFAGAPAFSLEASWISSSGEPRSYVRPVLNELAPGQNPATMWPFFSDPERGKPYMMLNMYLALRFVTAFYEAGDCARAMGLVDLVTPGVELWQARYDDVDIDADYRLMLQLRQNVEDACVVTAPVPPQDFEGGCMGI